MTSNVASDLIAAAGGHEEANYEAMKSSLNEALHRQFRPEFLNRIDEVIVFHSLTDAELEAIVGLLLADLARRLAGQDLALEMTPAARALVAREGHDPAFGARPLKRTIQRLVENPLARALLQGRFKPGDRILADADLGGGAIVFSSGKATVAVEATEHRDARAGSKRAGGGRSNGGRSGEIFDVPEIDPKKTPSGTPGGSLPN
jgi:ATP-dependent Clp protease ATP-binding subunit ClpA